MRRSRVAAGLGGLVTGLSIATAGLAQPGGAPPDAVGDEVLVTARKKSESLQEVPLSVAAFDSAQLQAQGLNNNFDIANLTVGFRTLQQTGRDIDRPIIRGMGAPASRGEPNASYFIDGTFVSGSISTATTSAVERVEILRGPQSAQFGRATFSGAVNYVTKKPTDTFQGQVNTRAGTNEDYSVGGWASGPLAEDKLYFVASANWSRYGGQWRNTLKEGQASYEQDYTLPFRQFLLNPPREGDSSRLGAEETVDVLGKLVWRPAAGSEVTLKYGFTDGDDSHFASLIETELNCYVPVPGTEGEPWYATSQGYYCGEFTAEGKVNRINIPDLRNGVTYRTPPGYDPADFTIPPADVGTFRTQNRVLMEYVQDLFQGYTLTARASWNRDEFRQLFDLDHTESRALWGLFHFDALRDVEDRSAELRLDTPADLALRASLGVYWYDQDRENQQRSYVGPAVAFGAGTVTTDYPAATFLGTTNEAVYGSVEWDFADRWTLTLEGRYARDAKDVTGGALGTTPSLPSKVPLDFDSFTPRVTVRFRPNEDLTLYALVAKGNKPGEFNTEFFRATIDETAVNAALDGCEEPAPPALVPIVPCLGEGLAVVDEEEQWTYELGAKAQWLDGRLTTNLAAYYIDWTNQGLFTTVQILESAGTYLTTTIIRNVGQSEVKGLELETSWRLTDRLTLVANYGYTDSRYVEGTDTILGVETDIGGRRVPSVPENTLILGASAAVPLGGGADAFLNLDYVFNSKRYTSANNFGWIGDDRTLNLRTGVQAGPWTVTGYVRNLTDDETPLAVLDFVNFGPVDVTYPVDDRGNLLNGLDPRMNSINPKRGRDLGLEVQYRF